MYKLVINTLKEQKMNEGDINKSSTEYKRQVLVLLHNSILISIVGVIKELCYKFI